MKRLISVAFAVSMFATLLAAVHAVGTPDTFYDKELNLSEHIASIIHDNADDCSAMGNKLARLVGNNAALLREAQKLTPEQRKQRENRYRAREQTARARMVGGIIKC